MERTCSRVSMMGATKAFHARIDMRVTVVEMIDVMIADASVAVPVKTAVMITIRLTALATHSHQRVMPCVVLLFMWCTVVVNETQNATAETTKGREPVDAEAKIPLSNHESQVMNTNAVARPFSARLRR